MHEIAYVHLVSKKMVLTNVHKEKTITKMAKIFKLHSNRRQNLSLIQNTRNKASVDGMASLNLTITSQKWNTKSKY